MTRLRRTATFNPPQPESQGQAPVPAQRAINLARYIKDKKTHAQRGCHAIGRPVTPEADLPTARPQARLQRYISRLSRVVPLPVRPLRLNIAGM